MGKKGRIRPLLERRNFIRAGLKVTGHRGKKGGGKHQKPRKRREDFGLLGQLAQKGVPAWIQVKKQCRRVGQKNQRNMPNLRYVIEKKHVELSGRGGRVGVWMRTGKKK